MVAEVLGRDYNRVGNRLWRDPSVHAKAKGIFGFLASHKDGFGVSPESIAAAMADGISAVKGALRELEQHGYLARTQVRTADGTMGATVYRITDMPSSEPVDGNQPPVVTSEDEENRRSEPVDGNPPADEPPAVDRPHKKTIPSQKTSEGEKTTSPSPPEPTEPADAADATEDGGGGGSDLRSTAAHIAAALDYLGHVPDKRQLEKVTAAVLGALTAGWSAQGLAVYLNLGTYRPDNPVAFYLSKLSPAKLPPPGALPAPRKPPAAGHRPFQCPPDSAYGGGFGTGVGTDAKVAGWAALTRQLAAREQQQGYQPFRNPVDQDVYDEPWPMSTADKRVAQAAALAAQLQAEDAADLPPWCGNYDCDPVTRTRDGRDDNGLPFVYPCVVCHPERAAA